jgi:hypothetical protein
MNGVRNFVGLWGKRTGGIYNSNTRGHITYSNGKFSYLLGVTRFLRPFPNLPTQRLNKFFKTPSHSPLPLRRSNPFVSPSFTSLPLPPLFLLVFFQSLASPLPSTFSLRNRPFHLRDLLHVRLLFFSTSFFTTPPLNVLRSSDPVPHLRAII